MLQPIPNSNTDMLHIREIATDAGIPVDDAMTDDKVVQDHTSRFAIPKRVFPLDGGLAFYFGDDEQRTRFVEKIIGGPDMDFSDKHFKLCELVGHDMEVIVLRP
jgi:hypothetical protein